MHTETHVRWVQQVLAYHDRGDFTQVQPRHALNWQLWEGLRARFGPELVAPLRSQIGVGYPDRLHFREALAEHLGSQVQDLEENFWRQADAGHRRFRAAFGWLLDHREDLAPYVQLVERSHLTQAHLKTYGLRRDSRQQLKRCSTPSLLLSRGFRNSLTGF
jgi:hypothetical protein